MRISLIGSGRVATHLAKKLAKQHQILQVYSRNIRHAEELAIQVNAQPIDQYSALQYEVDLVIIAVSDQAIVNVIEQLALYLPDILIAHTSGSTHLKVLSQFHLQSGVFYPLQTFSLACEIDWKSTPILIEATTDRDQKLLLDLANSLSKQVYQYASEQRLSLHLAAVFACNFSNYCYDAAKQIVDAQQVDFSLLYPLILETAQKALKNAPQHMQTGPAVREDQNILHMHQQLLSDLGRDDLKETYAQVSQAIQHRHQTSG